MFLISIHPLDERLVLKYPFADLIPGVVVPRGGTEAVRPQVAGRKGTGSGVPPLSVAGVVGGEAEGGTQGQCGPQSLQGRLPPHVSTATACLSSCLRDIFLLNSDIFETFSKNFTSIN